MWKDWPSPVLTGDTLNTFLKAILLPGEDWQVAASQQLSADALTSDQQGDVFFRGQEPKTYKLSADGKVSQASANAAATGGMAFGPDGRLYLADAGTAKITAIDSTGKATTIAEGIRGCNLVVTHQGNVYVTEPGVQESEPGKVWLIRSNGEKVTLDTGLKAPSGIVLSPDGLWLAVAEAKTHWGYSYQVQPDGTVQDKQQFYWFHVPDTADDSGVRASCAGPRWPALCRHAHGCGSVRPQRPRALHPACAWWRSHQSLLRRPEV